MTRIATAFFFCLLLAGNLFAQTTITLSSWVPPTTLMHRELAVPWAAAVEAASQGRIKVVIPPKGVASPPGHFDAVRDGLADVTYNIHGYVPGRFKLTKLPELPFQSDSAEALSVAYWRIHEKYLAQAGEHKGYKVLALFTHGPGNVYTTRKTITTMADFSGLKFRVGGGVVNDVAQLIGAQPVLKPAPESYELLSSGVVDGVFFPAESVESLRLEKLIQHGLIFPGGLYNTSFVFFMNEAVFNKMSKADQDAIMSVSGENLSRAMGRAWDARDRAAEAVFKAQNMQTSTASPALMAQIKSKTSAMESDWIKESTAKGLDGAKVLAEFKREVQRAQAR